MILPCTCLLLEVCVLVAIAILFVRTVKAFLKKYKSKRRFKK